MTWWNETEDLLGFRRSKHIYLGSERIVSRLSIEEAGPNYEDLNTYYYHPDHLGSVHSVSDSEGNPYERIEYTPYGEMWIEIREDANTKDLNYIPYRFTSKEWDSETGLYSFPARYFEPKLSRWMSADPAGFGLMNPMEEDWEGKLKPRQGYSIIESTNWYAYVSNNPVYYVDPTGEQQTAFLDFLYYIEPGAVHMAASEPTPFGEIAVAALTVIISMEEHRLKVLEMLEDGAVIENGVLVVKSEGDDTMPTPEELEDVIVEHNDEVDNSIPTTEVPRGSPDDQEPPPVKDTPAMKAVKIIGKLLELFDTISSGGN